MIVKKAYILLMLVSLCNLSGCVQASAPEAEPEAAAGSQELSIVTTSVAIAQILDALEYDNVVGVPETARDLPERYQNCPTAGAPMNPDYEIIKSIAPDLVLSPQSLESSLAQVYTTAGISSAFLDLSSVEGMYQAISSLGNLLGREAQAEVLTAGYEQYLEGYQAAEEGPRILLLMAFPDGFYLVATEDSYVGNLVKLAGGRNIYDDNFKSDENGFVSISPEDMIQQNPDMILVFAHYSEERTFEYMKSEFEATPVWQYYDAVTEGQICYLPSEYFGMSATLDWTQALDYLRPVFYEVSP